MDKIPLLAWQCVAVFFGVLFAIIFLLWLYNRREARRKHAMQLHTLMVKWGLDWFADLFECYAVGDYSGIVHKVREVVQTVRSDEALVGKLDEAFWKILAFYKQDAAKLAKIQEALAPPAKPATSATPATP